MAILVMLVAMLGQMANQAGKAWTRGESNKESLQNMRGITDFIGNELQAALQPICQPATNSLQFIVNPTSITSKNYNRDTIFWQAPLAADQTLGDVAEVGYFVTWNTTNPSNPTSQLCRFFVNPGAATVSNTNFQIYSNPTAWLSDSIVTAVAPANKQNFYQGLFAENVLGLWVQCLDPYGQPIAKKADGTPFTSPSYDSRLGYSYTTPANGTVTNPACALPAAVDISVVMLDSQSAMRIGGQQQTAINTILTSGANCPNASAFVTQAATVSTLRPIYSGLRSYQTRVYLQNSK
jgi:hypothetical protein